MYDLVWDELESDKVALIKPYTYQTIYLLKNEGDNNFMDIKGTTDVKETARDLFLLSFKKAAKRLIEVKNKKGNYKWANYKSTFVGHLLNDLPAFSRFNIPIGGDRNIVNATSENHGPSWRMIVEMSKPPKAFGIYPGGQSGNPGSKHYDNFIDDWAKGEYYQLEFLQSMDETENMIGTLILKPQENE